jgi:hypothetical protein
MNKELNDHRELVELVKDLVQADEDDHWDNIKTRFEDLEDEIELLDLSDYLLEIDQLAS